MAGFDLQVNEDVAIPLINQAKNAMGDVAECAKAFTNASAAFEANKGAADYAELCAEICGELGASLFKMYELFTKLENRTNEQIMILAEQVEQAKSARGRVKGGM